MSVFISYTSAYEYWRSTLAAPGARPSRTHPVPGHPARREELEELDLPRFGVRSVPAHMMTADARDRRQSPRVACHVWSPAYGPFFRLAPRLYVHASESCFVLMGTVLPFVDHVRFGFELCAAYARREDHPEGFCKRVPITTVDALARRAASMRGVRGVKQASRALRYVAGGSASPMETNLVISLCLPRMMGGFGLDLPELNCRVDASGLPGRDHFDCDLYWRKHRVAVEYDSAAHHEGRRVETSDSSRRSALAALGITVISVTPQQYFDARRLDETARAVARLTGKRLPSNDASWMMRRYRLRQAMIDDLPSETI